MVVFSNHHSHIYKTIQSTMKCYFIFIIISCLSYFSHGEELSIVLENRQLEFSGSYISGFYQKALVKPSSNRSDSLKFYVTGRQNSQIQVHITNSQSIESSKHKINFDKFTFGCGLNSSGKANINSNGKTELLCIGAQTTITPQHSAGIYSGSILLEVTYL